MTGQYVYIIYTLSFPCNVHNRSICEQLLFTLSLFSKILRGILESETPRIASHPTDLQFSAPPKKTKKNKTTTTNKKTKQKHFDLTLCLPVIWHQHCITCLSITGSASKTVPVTLQWWCGGFYLHARILGECLTVHSPPLCVCVF